MTALRFIASAAAVSTLLLLGTISQPVERQNAAASEKPVFDHSACQYPDRTTNPVNGCDNSDPCDAANAAKGGSGDCIDAVVQPEAPAVETTPALPELPEAVTIEGK